MKGLITERDVRYQAVRYAPQHNRMPPASTIRPPGGYPSQYHALPAYTLIYKSPRWERIRNFSSPSRFVQLTCGPLGFFIASMALRSFLLMILVLALAVAASPVRVRNNRITLPMARRTSQLGIRKVLQADRTRAALLQGGRKALREAKKKHHHKGNATDVAATGNSPATATAAAVSGSAASDTNVAATNQGEDYVVSVS